MATNTENIVIDNRTDKDGNPIKNLKIYDQFSENAYVEFDPTSFRSFGNVMRTTNRQLATIIRESYQKIFHDLRGVYIAYYPASRAPFMVEFYFAKNILPKPDTKINNLRDLTLVDGKRNNLYYQKKALNSKLDGHHFTLTDDTKLLLSDIMFGPKDQNKPNNPKWEGFIDEIWVPSGDPTYRTGAGELLVKVSKCFDIHKILQKVMPKTMIYRTDATIDESGNARCKNFAANAMYEVRFIKSTYNDPFVFIMNIEQFDKDQVEKMTTTENPMRRPVSGVIYY